MLGRIMEIEEGVIRRGHQQLVMVNYTCAFSQSESGKYFE